ncbi:MAG: adenylate/guanylate cyclase domain-containing protein [Spirochaetales bacterium]|nr:adenylate/guanylate cyclase domain-containing protein [Spirochaetales bacterium]
MANLNWTKLTQGLDAPPTLVNWLNKASEEQLFRINLKELSRQVKLDVATLIDYFLRAVLAGQFTLNWAYYCRVCGGMPGFKHNFKELKSSEQCPLCSAVFRNSLDTNVAVTFTVHPGLLPLPETLSQHAFDAMVKNFKEQKSSLPQEFLSGLEIINNPLYHELFGDDVLSTEESLEISRITLLFTDIKGSTQMYSQYGDATSYRIVRDHFKILFSAIEQQRGVVIKTIGDAVMASFLKPVDAINAALEAFQAFQQEKWEVLGGGLEIKMGVHVGPAIVVNLNDRVDYFGNTVNLAARIQGVADNHMICFSRDILNDAPVKARLKAWTETNASKIYRRTASLKGIDGPVELYSVV